MLKFNKFSINTRFSWWGLYLHDILRLCIYVKYANLPTQWWLSSKESVCNAGDPRGVDLIPRLGRSPRERNSNTLSIYSWENPTDREACLATELQRAYNWL